MSAMNKNLVKMENAMKMTEEEVAMMAKNRAMRELNKRGRDNKRAAKLAWFNERNEGLDDSDEVGEVSDWKYKSRCGFKMPECLGPEHRIHLKNAESGNLLHTEVMEKCELLRVNLVKDVRKLLLEGYDTVKIEKWLIILFLDKMPNIGLDNHDAWKHVVAFLQEIAGSDLKRGLRSMEDFGIACDDVVMVILLESLIIPIDDYYDYLMQI
jgi:hypothetical protein